MQELVKSFPLSVLLRNFFAGVFFMIGYLASSGRYLRMADLNGSEVTVLISLSLVAGVTAYTIHRSLTNPVIECIRYSEFAKNHRYKWTFMCGPAVEALTNRWKKSKPKGVSEKSKIQSELEKWADYIHLLYVSSMCIIAGSICGFWFESKGLSSLQFSAPLTFFCVFLFLCGFLSDWRRHIIKDILENEEKLKYLYKKNNTKWTTLAPIFVFLISVILTLVFWLIFSILICWVT